MRLPLVVFVTFAVATPIFGQQPAAAKKTDNAPKPKIVAPAPTPEPKRGVMSRIFGGKPKPTPTPAPTPQPVAVKPKPKPRPKPKATPAPAETEAPAPAATPAEPAKPEAEKPPTGEPAKPEAEPAKPAAETPAAEEPKAAPAKPGKPVKGAKPQPAEPELDDATKYKNAKAKAAEDAAIKDLKTKADSAIEEDDAHRASVAYNKALFRKIRQLDPSLENYVEKLEDAMMKRLNAEKR